MSYVNITTLYVAHKTVTSHTYTVSALERQTIILLALAIWAFHITIQLDARKLLRPSSMYANIVLGEKIPTILYG